jgi:hypothetical protein
MCKYLSQKQPRILTRLLTGHCHLNRQLDIPGCGRCKQALEMASRVLCDCEALATLRFRHLGEHFLKPGNSDNISNSRILHFVHSAGLLNALQKSCTKDQLWSKFTGHFCANPYYSILI